MENIYVFKEGGSIKGLMFSEEFMGSASLYFWNQIET